MITHHRVYLSAPFGGDMENLQSAIAWLRWAQECTPWGLWVQAPWIASAQAAMQRVEMGRMCSEETWLESGGIRVEQRTIAGYDAVLHVRGDKSQGQQREARWMVQRVGGLAYRVVDDRVTGESELHAPPPHALRIVETTKKWQLQGAMQ